MSAIAPSNEEFDPRPVNRNVQAPNMGTAQQEGHVDGHRKLPTGGHLWRILWPWFLPAYGQIVPHLL